MRCGFNGPCWTVAVQPSCIDGALGTRMCCVAVQRYRTRHVSAVSMMRPWSQSRRAKGTSAIKMARSAILLQLPSRGTPQQAKTPNPFTKLPVFSYQASTAQSLPIMFSIPIAFARSESEPTSFFCFLCIFHPVSYFKGNGMYFLASIDPSREVPVPGLLHPRPKLYHT